MFSKFRWALKADMAIDLGTANTLIYLADEGVVLEEPSVVALHNKNGLREVLAVGDEAKTMLGRTHDAIETVKPMQDGVIAEFIAAEEMLKAFIQKIDSNKKITRPKILICVPASSTSVERRAVYEAALAAGARKIYMIEEPVAAALGADLPVYDAKGSMVVDIGGGTTDIAVLSLGGVIYARSIRTAGNSMDMAILNYIRAHHDILIGQSLAEDIKLHSGSAVKLYNGNNVDVSLKGRNLRTGLPSEIMIDSAQITEALKDPIDEILTGIQRALEDLPPELSTDIGEQGICLTGGGAKLAKIDEEFTRRTGVNFIIPEDPLRCVVNGSAKALHNLNVHRDLLINID